MFDNNRKSIICLHTVLENNKPDLMIHDLKSNEIIIIEVGITNKRILPSVETTKGRKYEDLAGDLKLMFRPAKITLIPIVLTWDGLVTRHFSRYMRQLGISERLQAYIQTKVLKRTCESVIIDARGENLNHHLDSDQIQQHFDNLELAPTHE